MRVFLGAAAAICIAIGAVIYSQSQQPADDPAVDTRANLEAMMKAGQAADMFAMLEVNFPDDYARFFDEMATIVEEQGDNTTVGFEFARSFMLDVRRANAHHAASAPVEALQKISETSLQLLRSVEDRPLICAKVAFGGPAMLTQEEALGVDFSPMQANSIATFEALAAGRNLPVKREPATEADFAAVLRQWTLRADPTDGMEQAINSNDWQHPDYCAAAISMEQFFVDSGTDEFARVKATAIAAAAAQ